MPLAHKLNTDLSVIVSSLCGALVWFLNQHYFDIKKQSVAFVISFVMGTIGADFTIEIIKKIIPGIFSDERALGAFFCSALIITLTTNLIHRVSQIFKDKFNL